MRYEIAADPYRFDRDPRAKASIVRAEHLAYARFEATISHRTEGLLDLIFESPEGTAVVPWIALDGVMLLERETSPLVWPSWMRWIDPDVSEAIEARVEPWLRSHVVARFENAWGERFFDSSPVLRERVEYARAAGWLGAAPSSNVLTSIAPHRFAWRFASGAKAFVCGEGAANGGALLARRADSVQVILPNEQEVALARQWFGLDIFTAARSQTQTSCDLYVGPRDGSPEAKVHVYLDADAREGERRVAIAQPLPLGIMVSYDLDDAPEVRAISVAAPTTQGRLSTIGEPALIGGSAGKIALLVREDCLRATDADSDGVRTLERMLAREGFTVEIVAPSHFRPDGYDLIHLFGYRNAPFITDKLAVAAARGIPIAITPYADDRVNESRYQTGNVVAALAASNDDGLRSEYLEALALRKLGNPDGTPPDDSTDARRLFELARVAFVTCPAEEEHLRATFGFRGTAIRVPAFASGLQGATDVSALAGTGEFVLAHGPIDARSNHYLIARAAARAGLPLVVSGHVTDALIYQQLKAALGDLGIWIPAGELTPAQERGLIARARVLADVSWSGHGLHRLATGAGARCSLVVSANGYAREVLGEAAVVADPASVDSIEAALLVAWIESGPRGEALAARAASQCDPFAALVATVSGYQAATAQPVHP